MNTLLALLLVRLFALLSLVLLTLLTPPIETVVAFPEVLDLGAGWGVGKDKAPPYPKETASARCLSCNINQITMQICLKPLLNCHRIYIPDRFSERVADEELVVQVP